MLLPVVNKLNVFNNKLFIYLLENLFTVIDMRISKVRKVVKGTCKCKSSC